MTRISCDIFLLPPAEFAGPNVSSSFKMRIPLEFNCSFIRPFIRRAKISIMRFSAAAALFTCFTVVKAAEITVLVGPNNTVSYCWTYIPFTPDSVQAQLQPTVRDGCKGGYYCFRIVSNHIHMIFILPFLDILLFVARAKTMLVQSTSPN